MKPDDEIFGEAINLPEPQRAAYLEQACDGDAALRARILALLAGHGRSWNYLETLAQRTAVLPEEKPGDVIGRYKLLQKIGEGGCGAVYMAEQAEPVRRRVALKVIKLGMDTREVIARFEAERQALALMDHPNIARVLDAGATEAGRPFFAMELVRGVPITRYCDDEGLTTAQRLQLFVQVCSAVQHAHQKGIVHRDLKPSNILVTLHDGVPVPKVIDFGIAKATQGRLTDKTVFTAFEQFIGTPAYMSPEQAELSGLDVDTRADIYSLGVLLYELLTGRTPFDTKELLAAGVDEMRRRIREVEPPPPSSRLGTLQKDDLTATAQRRHTDAPKLINLLRGDLDWIVMRCLEKDRRRRYDSATSLAQDLQRHLNDEPVTARPPSALYRLRKVARRHKVAFAAGTVVLAALVTGLGFSAWSLGRERSAKSHARRLLYAADMNLAQQSLAANNLARARFLLDRHRPGNGAEDLRGWEWRYLWQQTRSDARAEVTRHTAMVTSISHAPDGRRFAAGYANGRVELWEPGPRWRRKILVESAGAAGFVAFSPDGRGLMATSGPGVIEWHDLATGEYVVRCRLPHRVRDLAFSRDGSRLAVTTVGEPAFHVVAAADGRVLHRYEVETGTSDYFDAMRISPDHERVYFSMMANGRRAVRCVRVADDQVLWTIDLGAREGATTIELSPDGRWLATATGFERDPVCVWDAATGARLATLDGHTKFVARLAFSADGRVLASGSSDQTIRIWDTSTWQSTALLRGHVEEIYALALSADGKSIVSGAEDGTVLQWSTTSPRPAGGRGRLPGHVAFAWALPGGQAVLGLTLDLGFSVIDLKTQQETPLPAAAPERRFFVPPNIFAEHDGRDRVEVYEMLAFGRRSLGFVPVGAKFEGGFAYSAANRLFAWSDGGTTLHVVSLDAPMQRIELPSNLPAVRPLNFTPDGRIVRGLWGSRRGVAWDVASRRLIEPNDSGWVASDRRVEQIGASNRPLLPLRQASMLRRAPVEGTRFRQPSDVGMVSGVALSGDGRTLAASSETGFLALMDYANIANAALLTGNMQDVDGVAFSPDSRRLATTSHGDEVVKLWDVQTRQELLTLAGEGSENYAVEFTDDGNTILVGRRPFTARPLGGQAQFWTAPSWAEIAAAERADAVEQQRR